MSIRKIPGRGLENTQVAANTYGGSSKVPVLTIDPQGRITSAANVNVAGVSNFSASGNTFTITTADGGSYSANIQEHSVRMGADTSGYYVATLTEGTGVIVSNGVDDTGSPAVVSIGQNVSTSATVTFSNVNITSNTTTNLLKSNVNYNNSANVSINAGIATLDLSLTNVFKINLTSSITSLTIDNPPPINTLCTFLLKVTMDGTARTITWPASVRWAGNNIPVLSSTAGKVDNFIFYTDDAGANFFGFISGQNA